MADVSMPRLSDSMEEGTILKWLKSDGDSVAKGEELVEIETDKANMTYEADEEGTLEIVAQEGDTLPVGETIARIGEGSGGGKSDESDGEDEAESDEEEGDEAKAESDDDDEQDESKSEDAGDDDAESEDDGDDEAKAESEDDDEAEGKSEGDDGDEDQDEGDEDDDAEAKAESDEEDGGERDEGEAEDEGDDTEAEGDQDEGDAKAESEAGAAARGGADGSAGNGRVKASPIARRMAREMGLELAGVRGTGPGGRIVKADVEAAARGGQKAEEAPEKAEREPAKAQSRDADTGRGETDHQDLSRLQRTVARRMAESKATAPDFVISLEVDMEEAVALRKQLKAAAGDGPAPSFNDFVVKASARALRDLPRANGAYRDGAFELYSRVNVGVAVAGQDALVVPTIFDADKKGLGTIAAETRALAEKVRDGKITPPELSGGTFTVSNLGMYGIRSMVPVINPPQAAILGVGELSPRPAVRDGELVVRSLMELTLVCDHRILYGADAAEFLARIREYLETPLKLAL
jgi:pyruvate dehydrogenase E2 component (dihydrolipoamide acetyltransferase)